MYLVYGNQSWKYLCLKTQKKHANHASNSTKIQSLCSGVHSVCRRNGLRMFHWKQIILETFLNISSLLQTDSLDQFLKGKLDYIQCMATCLINVLNRNHCGIIQEMNTSEVMVNYHNFSNTFHLTKSTSMALGGQNAA